MIELLLGRGERIHALDRLNAALHHAIHCGKGHMHICREAQIEEKDTLRNTPLHRAVNDDHDSIVTLLLDGADSEAKNGLGRTPSESAAP